MESLIERMLEVAFTLVVSAVLGWLVMEFFIGGYH
jgi:hypothetical protein